MPSEEDLQKMREGRYPSEELQQRLMPRDYSTAEQEKLIRERPRLIAQRDALQESIRQETLARLAEPLMTDEQIMAKLVEKGIVKRPVIGGAQTYEHVTPHGDEPSDHREGGCSCNPLIDEATHTVFHRPLST